MFQTRLRRFAARHMLLWCVTALLLVAMQPFLATHFRDDGWEDEPALRVRGVGEQAVFEHDDRLSHANWLETTLYVPAGAGIDSPHALSDALATLLGLVLLALPFAFVLALVPEQGFEDVALRRSPPKSGAPPPSSPWLQLPPKTAPPQ